MSDRRPDDDSLLDSWREVLDRLRREEDTRSWRESERDRERPRVVLPSEEEEERKRRIGRRRRMAAGLVVLLVGLGAYVVLSGRFGSVPGFPGDGGSEATPPAAADAVPSPADTMADTVPAGTAPTGPTDSVPPSADTSASDTRAAPAAASSGSDTAATPELLALFLGDSATVVRAMAADVGPGETGGDSVLVVRPGAAGTLWVGVRGAEGRPRAGVELVLEGSDRLPGVDERLEVTTDGRGRAAFRFPVGEVRDTLAMDVLARGYWLRGTNRVIVRPVP